MRGKTILTEVNNRGSRRDAFCSEGPPFWGQSLRRGAESGQPSPAQPSPRPRGRLRPQRPVHGRPRRTTRPAAAPHELAAARAAREGPASGCSPPRPAPRSARPRSAPRSAPRALGASSGCSPPRPRSSPPPTPTPRVAPGHPASPRAPGARRTPALTCLMYMAPRPSAAGRLRLRTAAAPQQGQERRSRPPSHSLPCGQTKWRRPRRRSPRVGRNHEGSGADRRGEAGPVPPCRVGKSALPRPSQVGRI